MAMNNVYYRFRHLVHASRLQDPAGQAAHDRDRQARLSTRSTSSSGRSSSRAVNGCGMCLESHEKVLRDHGLSAEQVQAGVRIAATVHAAARTLAAEEALTPALAQAA